MDDSAKLARSYRLPDSELRYDTYRASGPGGQKRNKTSSAVRVTHIKTGINVTATESRSQAQNRAKAYRRICHQVTLQTRLIPPEGIKNVDLHLSLKNDDYLVVMGEVLDALALAEWAVSPAAKNLGTTTGKLVDFLQRDPALWTTVNQHRARLNLRPLIQ